MSLLHPFSFVPEICTPTGSQQIILKSILISAFNDPPIGKSKALEIRAL